MSCSSRAIRSRSASVARLASWSRCAVAHSARSAITASCAFRAENWFLISKPNRAAPAAATSTAAGKRRRGYSTSPMTASTGMPASGMCSCCARAPSPLASPSAATATAITVSAARGGMRCLSRGAPAAQPPAFSTASLPRALAWPASRYAGGCQPRGRRGGEPAHRDSSLGRGLQGERDGVDAPALIGRHRVALALEHVAEMRVAPRAPDLGADHAQRTVLDQLDGVVAGRLVEARPATVGLEFLPRAEQLGTAGTAPVHALDLGVGVLTGPRRLGARFPEYLVLIRGKHFAPLRLGSLDLAHVAETTSPDNRYRGDDRHRGGPHGVA